MMRKIIVAVALMLCFQAAPARADSPMIQHFKAYAVYKMGDYEGARNIWQRLADSGNADAYFNLGTLAEDGLGGPQDRAEAIRLYRQGAEQGSTRAQYRLALLKACEEPSDPEAAQWFRKAADAGDDEAVAWLNHLKGEDPRPSDCPY